MLAKAYKQLAKGDMPPPLVMRGVIYNFIEPIWPVQTARNAAVKMGQARYRQFILFNAAWNVNDMRWLWLSFGVITFQILACLLLLG